MTIQNLRPDEIEADLRRQLKQLDPGPQKRLAEVIGRVMRNMVLIRFLTGKGPFGKLWKSWAKETKFNGRFSKAYRKRPSGDLVTADKIRNTDTRTLANSYEVTARPGYASVGPGGKQKELNSIIANKEEEHGNYITGWDNTVGNAANAEIVEFLDRMALGQGPQSVPVSSIGRRQFA